MKLTTKLVLAVMIAGIIPAALISKVALDSTQEEMDYIGGTYDDYAQGIAEKIDRTLMERYGDSQSFASNGDLQDLRSWYIPDSTKNKAAAVSNKYVGLYSGYYALAYMVDTRGKLVAVNDRDTDGNTIDVGFMYQKDFSEAQWFIETLNGNFTKGTGITGTLMDDVHVDDDVARVYGGAGLVMGFSSQVKDANGKVIGVWRNCANFSLVEEIVQTTYKHLVHEGHPDTEFAILDRGGRILMDYDPTRDGTDSVIRNTSVILKTNLVASGNEAAREVTYGKTGHMVAMHTRKNVLQVCGYAACKPILGSPTFKWGVLCRTNAESAFDVPNEHRGGIISYLSWSVAGLFVFSLVLSQSIARSVGRSVNSLNHLSGSLTVAAGQFSRSSNSVATASSEQAAALEETSASLEEISAMTNRTSENANNGKGLSGEARSTANLGLERITEMGNTLGGIRSAVMEMESAVREMQSSSQEVANIINTIDEIAFQTNLLALNAAVEAARAGEAGMGFAVVADEVRALAQRSALAAKETAQKIESSIRRSEQSGEASTKVVRSLGEVVNTAGNLEAVFKKIVEYISSLDEVINETAVACTEQSTGISQVNMAVNQMDRVTQSNSSVAEENAALAEELNAHINSLNQVTQDLQKVVAGKATSVVQSPLPTGGGPTGLPASTRKIDFSSKPSLGTGLKKPGTSSTPALASSSSASSGSGLIPMPGDSGGAKNAGSLDEAFKDF